MGEMLEMTLGERMMLLSFASKALELIEANDLPPSNPMNYTQLTYLGEQIHPILARLDRDYPAMISLPHDGVSWKDRP
jgi:hypothetical protein